MLQVISDTSPLQAIASILDTLDSLNFYLGPAMRTAILRLAGQDE